MPLTTDAYFEAESLYQDVRDEWHKNQNTVEEMNYWQGKKDGIRSVLALLAPDAKEKYEWELLNNSASGHSRATTREILEGQVKDAHRILNLLVHYPDYNPKGGAKQWLAWVKRTGTLKP